MRKSDLVGDKIAQLRAFTLKNADSVKFYKLSLQEVADPAVPGDRAFLKYAEGLYHLTIGLHKNAKTDFNAALKIFDKEGNDLFVASCLVGIASCHKLTGEPDRAIITYQQALKIYQRLDDREKITVAYVNLAETYQQKNDLVKSREYLEKAKANEELSTRTYAVILHLEANLYGMSGKCDSAILIDRAGIEMATLNNYPEKLSPFYDNIARCRFEQKLYDSAEFYYRKCIFADSLNGRIQLMADTYAQLVSLYAATKEEAKMLRAADRSNKLCDSTQYLRGKLTLFEGLDTYYSNNGEWQQVAKVKDSVHSVYQRLVSEETEGRIAEYNVAFETAEKEKTIAKQNDDLQNVTRLTVLLSAIALLLLTIIFVSYRNYKTRKKIAVQRATDRQKDINVKAVFESEQAERIRIARDLHDSLGQKLSVLKMYISSRSNPEEKTSSLLDDAIQEVRNISHDLLPEELNFGLVKALRADIEKWQEAGSFKVSANIKESNAYSKLPTLTSLNILRIFRELLHNLSLHGNAGQITIDIGIDESLFDLQISDDGDPIDPSAIAGSKGLGWKNINARVNMLKGDIRVFTDSYAKNTVHIKIPVA